MEDLHLYPYVLNKGYYDVLQLKATLNLIVTNTFGSN